MQLVQLGDLLQEVLAVWTQARVQHGLTPAQLEVKDALKRTVATVGRKGLRSPGRPRNLCARDRHPENTRVPQTSVLKTRVCPTGVLKTHVCPPLHTGQRIHVCMYTPLHTGQRTHVSMYTPLHTGQMTCVCTHPSTWAWDRGHACVHTTPRGTEDAFAPAPPHGTGDRSVHTPLHVGQRTHVRPTLQIRT